MKTGVAEPIDQATRLRELANDRRESLYTSRMTMTPFSVTGKRKGRIVAVTSGKGGVGKTNFVINLALALSRMKKKVVVLDLDLGLANIDILLNLTPRYNMEDYLQGRKALGDILVEGPWGIKLLPGGSGIPRLADLDDGGRRNFIEGFRVLIDQFDYVLLDTGAGISKNVIEFVLIADDVIVITTPEPTAITDAYAAMKIIGSRNKDVSLFLLFNMVSTSREADVYFKKIHHVVRQFLKISPAYLGYVLNDPCVRQSIMKRKPFMMTYPFSNAARCLNLVARKLLYVAPSSEEDEPGFLKRFSSMFIRKPWAG